MEEYLEKLLTQIRCKKARPFVEEELRGHIEDQISDYMASGMDMPYLFVKSSVALNFT